MINDMKNDYDGSNSMNKSKMSLNNNMNYQSLRQGAVSFNKQFPKFITVGKPFRQSVISNNRND